MATSLDEQTLRANIGRGVAHLREWAGLRSQLALAKELGWSQQKISQIENGRSLGVFEFRTLKTFFSTRLDLPPELIEELMVSGGLSPSLRLVPSTNPPNSGVATQLYPPAVAA